MEPKQLKERKRRFLIVRVTDTERRSIEALAERTGRTISEAARELIRNAAGLKQA